MPKLEAIKQVRYGGKTIMPGETFDASEKNAKVLKAIEKAKDATPEPPKTQRRPPAKVVEKVVEAKVEAPKPPESTHPWVSTSSYNRRDMKAED